MPENSIFLGLGEKPVHLPANYINRHGLVAGATGTGKTVTLQVMSEGLSSLGIPVFVADVKGDLSGISQAGGGKDAIDERASQVGLPPLEYRGFPTIFWDLFGEQGHPIRTTISDMGPLILSRLLSLNDTQEGILNALFKMVGEQGLLLLDMDDLRSALAYMGENASELRNLYGNISPASVGAIQRSLLVLEEQGGEAFFGEPALDINEFMRSSGGQGTINILAADKLMHNPRLYSTFLLWLLSELFEDLPEAGDLDKPKLVFFFDEAHLLFDDAPDALVDKVEQVVRLIRSKGVGVFFVTQNPLDIPDTVRGQLGNRVQHALRAFTPADQKAVRAAANTFRQNEAFDAAEAITQLGVGEALVSVLEGKGTPSVVERTLMAPPTSRIGPCTPDERRQILMASPIRGFYDRREDRESAHEILRARREREEARKAEQEQQEMLDREARRNSPRRSTRETPVEAAVKSGARSLGTQVARAAGQALIAALLGMFTARKGSSQKSGSSRKRK